VWATTESIWAFWLSRASQTRFADGVRFGMAGSMYQPQIAYRLLCCRTIGIRGARMLEWLRRLALVVALVTLGFPSARAERSPPQVDREEFRRLWILAAERMPPPTPLVMEASLLIRKHDQIWIDHEYVIDAEGNPSDYRFHSIEPPEVDPRPFEALVMVFRYRPVEGVEPTPVRFRGREHFHWPRPARPGED
jgi:hypothetical protein